MANKKKSFLDTANKRESNNPTMAFISKESIEEVEAVDEIKEPAIVSMQISTSNKPPKGYKLNPLYIETKTKRLQLVIQPSLYEKIKAASKAAGLSLNEYCHRVLDKATEK